MRDAAGRAQMRTLLAPGELEHEVEARSDVDDLPLQDIEPLAAGTLQCPVFCDRAVRRH
jgi:hypothetical protein